MITQRYEEISNDNQKPHQRKYRIKNLLISKKGEHKRRLILTHQCSQRPKAA